MQAVARRGSSQAFLDSGLTWLYPLSPVLIALPCQVMAPTVVAVSVFLVARAAWPARRAGRFGSQ
eukprot:5954775-Alexandrium_andersonii.AAC.1